MMFLSLYVKPAPSIISFQVFKDENRLAVIDPLTGVMANVLERTEASCFLCIYIFLLLLLFFVCSFCFFVFCFIFVLLCFVLFCFVFVFLFSLFFFHFLNCFIFSALDGAGGGL